MKWQRVESERDEREEEAEREEEDERQTEREGQGEREERERELEKTEKWRLTTEEGQAKLFLKKTMSDPVRSISRSTRSKPGQNRGPDRKASVQSGPIRSSLGPFNEHPYLAGADNFTRIST